MNFDDVFAELPHLSLGKRFLISHLMFSCMPLVPPDRPLDEWPIEKETTLQIIKSLKETMVISPEFLGHPGTSQMVEAAKAMTNACIAMLEQWMVTVECATQSNSNLSVEAIYSIIEPLIWNPDTACTHCNLERVRAEVEAFRTAPTQLAAQVDQIKAALKDTQPSWVERPPEDDGVYATSDPRRIAAIAQKLGRAEEMTQGVEAMQATFGHVGKTLELGQAWWEAVVPVTRMIESIEALARENDENDWSDFLRHHNDPEGE